VTDPEQLDLDFHAPSGEGYENWQWDRKQARRRIAEVWGVAIGQYVRLRIRDIDGEFNGKLILRAYPSRLTRKQPLQLRIGSVDFLSSEIESCAVLRKEAAD